MFTIPPAVYHSRRWGVACACGGKLPAGLGLISNKFCVLRVAAHYVPTWPGITSLLTGRDGCMQLHIQACQQLLTISVEARLSVVDSITNSKSNTAPVRGGICISITVTQYQYWPTILCACWWSPNSFTCLIVCSVILWKFYKLLLLKFLKASGVMWYHMTH